MNGNACAITSFVKSLCIVFHSRVKMPCSTHIPLKKGDCKQCGKCISCPANRRCTKAKKHEIQTNKRVARNPLPAHSMVETPANVEFSDPKTKYNWTDQPINIDNEFKLIDNGTDRRQTKICQLLQLLDLEKDLLGVPINGYCSIQFSNSSKRSMDRIRYALKSITTQVCNVLSIDVPNTLIKLIVDIFKVSETRDRLKESVITLNYNGNRATRTIMQALLVNSYYINECNTLLSSFKGDIVDPVSAQSIIGKEKASGLRQYFNLLATGQSKISKKNKDRVPLNQISQAMEYIMNVFQMIPGYMKSIHISGHYYSAVPVFTRGGQSLETTFKNFANSIPNYKTHLGYPTFTLLLSLLTSPGKSHAGLSTYYIDLIHMSNIFIEITAYMNCISEGIGSELKRDWEEHLLFVQYEYCTLHINDTDTDTYHCLSFAIGLNCAHDHSKSKRCCMKCHLCFTFFPEKVTNILNTFINQSTPESEIILRNIHSALNLLQKNLIRYAAHKIREKHQKSYLEQRYEDLALCEDNAIISIDHKQKVLPSKNREGQSDYFGKKGMSVLGAMLITNGNIVNKLKIEFIDFVVDNTTAQDAHQVSQLLVYLVRQTHSLNSKIKYITIQSDNASCFASLCHVKLIFHMNIFFAENSLPTIKQWIFGEAQTGKNRLDTHFSYIQAKLNAYICESGFEITLPEHIVEAITYGDGLAGTTAILCPLSPILNALPTIKTVYGVRSIHDIKYDENKVEIRLFSGVGKPEVFSRAELYDPNYLLPEMNPVFLAKQSMKVSSLNITLKSHEEDQIKVKKIMVTDLGLKIEELIDQSDIKKSTVTKNASRLNQSSDLTKPILTAYWAEIKMRKDERMCIQVYRHLHHLYLQGEENKAFRIGADAAFKDLSIQILVNDFKEKLLVTPAKIKAFFSRSKANQIKCFEVKKPNTKRKSTKSHKKQDKYKEKEFVDSSDNTDNEENARTLKDDEADDEAIADYQLETAENAMDILDYE